VPCDDPAAKVVALHLEGAAFAWAEPSPEGRGLYFSYGGVYFYEYATNSWGPVIEPPLLSQCWMAESPVRAEEYVVGWVGDGALAVLTGGPCGFEAEWLGAAEVIEIPTELAGSAAGEPRRRPAAHVASVSADARGRLWVANGGLCSEASTKMSRGAAGLWRSADDGEAFREGAGLGGGRPLAKAFREGAGLGGGRPLAKAFREGAGLGGGRPLAEAWDFVEIPELDGHGVDAVWTAASAPDRLLIRSECCYVEAADFCPGGKLLLSEDAGASWARVSPSASESLPGDASSYGPVEQLHVGPELLELEALVRRDIGPLHVRSSDGGRHWMQLKSTREIVPSPVSRELELNGWVFAAGPDGLLRHRPAERADVVLRPLVINTGR
jgi:hypothetical protein